MSADNGIYILKTRDQYRVINAQAIENLYWSYLDGCMKNEMVSTRIVEFFGETRYTRDGEKAQKVAFAMAKDSLFLEYGIQIIPVNKFWRQIVKEAKALAKLEYEVLKDKGDRWKWDLERLEKVLTYKN